MIRGCLYPTRSSLHSNIWHYENEQQGGTSQLSPSLISLYFVSKVCAFFSNRASLNCSVRKLREIVKPILLCMLLCLLEPRTSLGYHPTCSSQSLVYWCGTSRLELSDITEYLPSKSVLCCLVKSPDSRILSAFSYSPLILYLPTPIFTPTTQLLFQFELMYLPPIFLFLVFILPIISKNVIS